MDCPFQKGGVQRGSKDGGASKSRFLSGLTCFSRCTKSIPKNGKNSKRKFASSFFVGGASMDGGADSLIIGLLAAMEKSADIETGLLDAGTFTSNPQGSAL